MSLSCQLSNLSLKKISKMSQLRKLAFSTTKVKPDAVASLTRLTELRSLRLPWCGLDVDVVSSLVHVFNHLKKLEEVDIHSYYLSDEVVESLVSSNPSLHHINISRSNSLTITRSSLCLESAQAKMKSKFFRQENFDGVQVSVTKKN